ncbi:MAG: RagB/SusD family nutrient uptake outer membrane protein, partial [Parabacteroides sp.]|nr:RagB/SusD family nutrient uptake outer membrane protein [Parabacteroides sp.]
AHGNMKSFHELRPIPQSQIDRCTNVYPQNPQW